MVGFTSSPPLPIQARNTFPRDAEPRGEEEESKKEVKLRVCVAKEGYVQSQPPPTGTISFRLSISGLMII